MYFVQNLSSRLFLSYDPQTDTMSASIPTKGLSSLKALPHVPQSAYIAPITAAYYGESIVEYMVAGSEHFVALFNNLIAEGSDPIAFYEQAEQHMWIPNEASFGGLIRTQSTLRTFVYTLSDNLCVDSYRDYAESDTASDLSEMRVLLSTLPEMIGHYTAPHPA